MDNFDKLGYQAPLEHEGNNDEVMMMDDNGEGNNNNNNNNNNNVMFADNDDGNDGQDLDSNIEMNDNNNNNDQEYANHWGSSLEQDENENNDEQVSHVILLNNKHRHRHILNHKLTTNSTTNRMRKTRTTFHSWTTSPFLPTRPQKIFTPKQRPLRSAVTLPR